MENTINLYCGYALITLGSEVEGDDYREVDYYEGLPADCLDGLVRGKLFIRGEAEQLLNIFKTSCKYVEAAGGYVLNALGQSLVIVRNGLYDLPKGKIELGEDPETAAVREVNEETGVTPKIERKLIDTYHFYRWGEEKEVTIKKTYWYLMSLNGSQATKPQTEEGITSCIWMDDAMMDDITKRTHRNLKTLFDLKRNGEI
ncbi:MAG: NUDIX domain-containing protein [Bacteroidales bacterium]|nr:NUDIX domain-containing protein [Bacteroidales bacterium]MBP5681624.1 NUDIX domain-containing protein [Bacteroidales bacterium]